jgi:Domain of unknown function (DUF4349)
VSQPDLQRKLREARPLAPAELRVHVRRLAADASPAQVPSRRPPRFTWPRLLLVAVPVAVVAAAGAAVLLSSSKSPGRQADHGAAPVLATGFGVGPAARSAPVAQGTLAPGASSNLATVPSPSPNRAQRIRTTLELRVASAQAVSDDTKRIVRIARSLGGYPASLVVNAAGRSGYAQITLRIPKEHLQSAIARVAALGTIVGEHVTIQDLESQLNATTRTIARLKAELTGWQQQVQTAETQKHIAALTDEIVSLRGRRAATIRTASDATVSVELTTRPAPAPVHHRPGPLHGLLVAFRWLGIGAVYVLALGAPLIILGALVWLAARSLRRHREASLLSRS